MARPHSNRVDSFVTMQIVITMLRLLFIKELKKTEITRGKGEGDGGPDGCTRIFSSSRLPAERERNGPALCMCK